MRRFQALLTAGALSGVVLVALFWWGGNNSEAAPEAEASSTPIAVVVQPPTPNADTSLQLQQLLDQNQQLRQTIETLVGREAAYQQQLEEANQQILSAQVAQPASATSIRSWLEADDEDEHEAQEHRDIDGDKGGDKDRSKDGEESHEYEDD